MVVVTNLVAQTIFDIDAPPYGNKLASSDCLVKFYHVDQNIVRHLIN